MTTCPKCHGPQIALMSQNEKLCVDCLLVVPFKLKEGQQSLIKATR